MLTVTNGGSHDWANMPLDETAAGNAMDCDFTFRLYSIVREQMKEKGLHHVYDKLIKKAAYNLSEVEDIGVRVDREYLAELDVICQEELQSLVEVIKELSPVDDLNPNSTKQLAELLFSTSGFDLTPVEFSAKTKTPSITESHMSTLIASSSGEAKTFIQTLLRYKSRFKQHKTYVKGVEKALDYNGDGRIYSNYNFSTTVTGRLSCSLYSCGKEKKGVSFHTLPRPEEGDPVNIRKLIIPDEGNVFLAADFSQAELRVLAQCCRDENLIKAFNSGQDLHSFTASLIYSKPIEKVTKVERQVAKSVSFLIVYGGGPHKLSEQIGKPVGYCKNIFSEYQNSFPKVFSWMKLVHKSVRANGHAVSLFGRRRNLSNVNSPIKKYQFRALRQGMNFVIQSSASDIMLQALNRLKERLEEANLDFDLLATVHDSVELQCPKSQLKQVLEVTKSALTDTSDFKDDFNLDFIVPFEVDIEVGNSFGEAIETEFTPNGSVTNLSEIEAYVENN